MQAEIALDAAQPVTLYQEPGGRPRFCQLEAAPGGAVLHWMVQRLEAGQTAEFRLVPMLSRKKPASRLRWHAGQENQGQLTLDGQAFAGFEGRSTQVAPGLSPIYAPGEAAGQVAITSLWIAADTPTPRLRTLLKRCLMTKGGPVVSRFTTQGVWLGTHDERILEEFVAYTFHATPAELRLLDVDVSLRASFGPVSLGPNGPLHVELPPELAGPHAIAYRNSEGAIGRLEVEDRRAAWLQIAGRTSVAVFEHPQNLSSPGVWNVGNGPALSPRPFARAPVTLPAGEVLTLRYRLCLQADDRDGEGARQRYLDYAYPPQVEIAELP